MTHLINEIKRILKEAGIETRSVRFDVDGNDGWLYLHCGVKRKDDAEE